MRAKLIFAALFNGLLLASASHAEDSFAGIGVMLAERHQAIEIIHILADTPASRAGLSEGLVVNKIDGTATDGKPLRDCVDMLRGPVGTKVRLELVDTANSKTNTVELTRERIPVLADALSQQFHQPVADSPAKSPRPAIYDESADGAKQIADALAVAKKDNKRVLLQFGANWCGWCHKLHKLCESDAGIAAKLKEAYVVVLVDVNKGHNEDINKRYENPTRFGLPVLVVLDSDGKALTTQDTGKLEEDDHHSPAKVLAFLNEWAVGKR
jgi:thiol-disulfide isomerase/thioredoxin